MISLFELFEDDKEGYSHLGTPIEKKDVFKYVYHLADPKKRDYILKHGIKASGGEWATAYGIPNAKAVFASNSPYPENWFDFGKDYDVYAINTDTIDNEWFYDANTGGEYYIATPQDVPKSAVTLIHKGDESDVRYKGFFSKLWHGDTTNRAKLAKKRKDMVIPQSFREKPPGGYT